MVMVVLVVIVFLWIYSAAGFTSNYAIDCESDLQGGSEGELARLGLLVAGQAWGQEGEEAQGGEQHGHCAWGELASVRHGAYHCRVTGST